MFAQLPGKKFGTLWAYRALADAYREELVGAADGRRRSFGDALAGVVDAMAGKPVTAAELLAAFSIDDSVDAAEKGSLFAGGVAR